VLTVSAGSVSALEKKFTNHLGMEFIKVEPGSFIMGSPESEPYRDKNENQHKVTISRAFYLQATEVTLKQWEALMGTKLLSRKPKDEKNLPVTKVSFYDTQKFIKKLNSSDMVRNGRYMLPTEAQWEYACRAGTQTAYSWGDEIDCSKAMYQNNSKKASKCISLFKTRGMLPDRPAPVKSFAPNPWGFYDMHGNVWEWCSDPYREYNTDASAKSGTRIKRGGSWFKYGIYLRSANRAYAHPGGKFQTTGFRLVFKAE